MPILKLTQDLINRGLHCPPDKNRTEYCDAELRGLYLEVRVSSAGDGTYYWRYKNAAGTTAHQRIGKSSETTLAEARKRAKELRAEIQLGADPRGDVKAAKAVITLGDFFDNKYLDFVRPRKRSWKRDVELFVRWRRDFGNKRLNEITRHQVQTFHAKLLTEGLSPASADHHLKLIRHALNLAVEWQELHKNPAQGVKQFNVDNRVEHLLSDVQLANLMNVLNTHPNRVVCLIAIWLLATGARLNEALQANWSQIDRPNRVWRIPAANSKSKRVRSVALNDSALDVLKRLDTENEFDHLFINRKTRQPYTTIMKVFSRLRNMAGLPQFRIHDLRHQHASFLVNSGHSLYSVSHALGHQKSSTSERYAHLSSKSLQDAANSASVAIMAASGASPTTAIGGPNAE